MEAQVSERDPQGLLLTIEEAARMLRIGRTKMCELLATAQVESVQIGRLRRVPFECLQGYIADLLDSGDAEKAA
ncbi:excisionase family DNA-binding protein [Phytoactinopolyspora mesophila]|uniref:Excisionase family DNA-binding protein n=1 Tax=Phytoactinopolyspora mesophila TaxID=2650750 RepID=A0A7K3MCS1_9ACTN|nr:excisionase family DNA-binding protein [Phytoactinopolyspora mesophila]NDL60990.1 excisionase family DNA-binding protein [Phytoactinopolyspora mesophila]